MTRLYFAPLEGITGFAYRNVHHELFCGIDKYYAPFIAPNYTRHFKTREGEDIAPANNGGIPLVPQILTNRAEDFLWAAGQIAGLGYEEINLNLGCPMPTVVKKHRGSGQLGDLEALDRFLDQVCEGLDRQFGLESSAFAGKETKHSARQGASKSGICGKSCCSEEAKYGAPQGASKSGIYSKSHCREEGEGAACPGNGFPSQRGGKGKLRFSIKTRIGLDSAENAAGLVKIYNRYPLSELIVHPRTQKDLYGGSPDLETFALFLEGSLHPLVYNGDIFTAEDSAAIMARFPGICAQMLGRGLIANPALAREAGGGEPLKKEELRAFHDAVFTSLQMTLPGPGPLIGKMKELWFYMGRNFADAGPWLKEIRKARDLAHYQAAVRVLFSRCAFLRCSDCSQREAPSRGFIEQKPPGLTAQSKAVP